MKYYELITKCNKVCFGVDDSSHEETKQMCMKYIKLAIRRYLNSIDDDIEKVCESIRSDAITHKYRKLLWNY